MSEPAEAAALRQQIVALTRRYHDARFGQAAEFEPGTTQVPYAGRVFDGDELALLVESSLDFWLTTGRFAAQFERAFASFYGLRHALLCNSGSSANLLAISALTSPLLGERRLRAGDEVLTVAAGFPTTVNPIVQNGLVPVFVDVELGTYNVDVAALREAVGPKTRAIVLAHTLGNPFDLDAVAALAREHDLWLVEDCCDAVGSTYRGRLVGTFGDLMTTSFYPAHHITMGEGGCVLTNRPRLKRAVESFRDWGRDCWCEPGAENTCGKRHCQQLGSLPYGYDHKFTYLHVGYNLKATDMQAAVGVAQLPKLQGFVEARRGNWRFLRESLQPLQDVLLLPEATEGADPAWFGFPILVREGAPFTRDELVAQLEARKVATRLVFAGNLIRQPAYRDVPHRVSGSLANTDAVAERALWLGVYPGLTRPMLEHVVETVHSVARVVGAAA